MSARIVFISEKVAMEAKHTLHHQRPRKHRPYLGYLFIVAGCWTLAGLALWGLMNWQR